MKHNQNTQTDGNRVSRRKGENETRLLFCRDDSLVVAAYSELCQTLKMERSRNTSS